MGDRVTIRYRLHGDPSGAAVTDALGYITAVDAATVTVETKRRGTAVIDRTDITHAKLVPPPPVRRVRPRPE